MKKKFLILTLCFTLIFSSFNYKKSYADAGVISAPIVATVVTTAIGCGLVLNTADDIYSFASSFYNTYKDNWNHVEEVFNASVSMAISGLVTVGKEFKDLVVDYLDNYFVSGENYVNHVSLGDDKVFQFSPIRDYGLSYSSENSKYISTGEYVNIYSSSDKSNLISSGVLVFQVTYSPGRYGNFYKYGINVGGYVSQWVADSSSQAPRLSFIKEGDLFNLYSDLLSSPMGVYFDFSLSPSFDVTGVYNPGSVTDKDNLDVYIPGDLSDLVGVGDVSTPSYPLTDGLVSVPGVSNPSISVDTTIPFPGVSVDVPDVDVPDVDVPDVDVPGVDSPSVPSEGVWATIKEFIISLVVPNDTYWTDTWGGLYDNFTNSFPMVDMDGFNDLVTGEKKFPNIDVDIMGVTGRVVNGDVINSIVDWLRPIVAGFMMLCLMLFNYRKIYKLIRNSEPFGGIAPGTSDFSTGISEYSKQEVVKATDMVAEYRAWKERGGK